jgi:hypothetical protein
VLEKVKKCTYNNTNAIIGLLMCTAAWINVKVLPVIAATSMSEKCKGDQKRRPRMQTQVNGTPTEALVDSGASDSVMSEKAFKTVWEEKTECQLRKDVSKPSADKQRYPMNFLVTKCNK